MLTDREKRLINTIHEHVDVDSEDEVMAGVGEFCMAMDHEPVQAGASCCGSALPSLIGYTIAVDGDEDTKRLDFMQEHKLDLILYGTGWDTKTQSGLRLSSDCITIREAIDAAMKTKGAS